MLVRNNRFFFRDNKQKMSRNETHRARVAPLAAGTAGGEGALLELNARGEQDAHLYGFEAAASNEFTTESWRRATPGALELKVTDVELVHGKPNRIPVPRRGDLIGDMYLEITLPKLTTATAGDRWIKDVAYILINNVSLFIDDVELSHATRYFYYLDDQMFTPRSKQDAIDELIGHRPLRMDRDQVVALPLKFFTRKRHHSFQTWFPCMNASRSDIVIDFGCEKLQNATDSTNKAAYYELSLIKTLPARLFVNYVMLDKLERARFISRPTPVLAEVVTEFVEHSWSESTSTTGLDDLLPSDRVTIDMSAVNFPVKYIVFAAVSTLDLKRGVYDNFLDIIEEVSIRLDGVHERETIRTPEFFSMMQEHAYFKKSTSRFIYLYSFSIDPANTKPTGHFAMSTTKKTTVQIKLKEPRRDVQIRMYCAGYKFIDFIEGVARVKFI